MSPPGSHDVVMLEPILAPLFLVDPHTLDQVFLFKPVAEIRSVLFPLTVMFMFISGYQETEGTKSGTRFCVIMG